MVLDRKPSTSIANVYPLEQATTGWNDIASRHLKVAAAAKEKSKNGKTVLQVI